MKRALAENRIKSAMILSAGLGTRMHPITQSLPKPLVEVAGKPLISYAIDALRRAGISHLVANVHHLADKMEDWLASSGQQVSVSDERAGLLDSGGGVLHALPLLGPSPFIVLNADTFWLEDPSAPHDNLDELIFAFDPARMDILMLTARLDQATGHGGHADFTMSDDGQLRRWRGSGNPVIYAGALIIDPAILSGERPSAFSLNVCFDEAIARGRLFGLPMHGHWLTVGTPEAIDEAETAMDAYMKAPNERRQS